MVYYYKTLAITAAIQDRLTNNILSASNIALSHKGYLSNNDSTISLDLFEEGNDSVYITTAGWGCFNTAQVQAVYHGRAKARCFFYGASRQPYSDATLYLTDNNRPLGLGGKTVIQGKAYLPKAGVKVAFVDQQGFSGDHLINGPTDTSNAKLPALDPAFQLFAGTVLSYLQQTSSSKDKNESFGLPDSSTNIFSRPVQVIHESGVLKIDSTKLHGKILVIADSAIEVTSMAHLEDIIIVAPRILFKAGFTGVLQAFATDSIIVEKDCHFYYPSALVLVPKKKVEVQPKIRLNNGVIFEGCIYTIATPKTVYKPLLHIDTKALVYGMVYCNGYLRLNGNVNGSVFTDYFLYPHNASLFENMVRDAEIRHHSAGDFGYWIKASTMVEVIVALVIIMLIFMITTFFFVNATKGGFTVNQAKGEGILEEYMTATREEKLFTDEVAKREDFYIERTVKSYPGEDALWMISFTLYNKNHERMTQKKIVLANE
ncbi:hypothetical protein F5148DRAFT_1293012 [Russula earlei]|uniref:Uncharacterized protein n=1 Tax=Russula earlei TaxID=71964 RepID=A0ACC0TV36_9AGAM|nr:hypothetical protein F5148DRAFT_1293012 [Russula earlei]